LVSGALVIGADQILVHGDRWLGKPDDLAGARAQLWSLRGHTHHLATAMAVYRGGRMIWHHIESPRLTMRAFSEAFMDAYLAAEGHQLLSSVGCYRLEGRGIQLFSRIEGDHSAILGLPLLPLLGFLREQGVVAT
jgi:septum formation protein